jgi:predicted CXXCH cytochrome family protein
MIKSSKLLKSLAASAVFIFASGTMFGALENSAHDFTGGAEDAWNTGGEMCAPCHTTHNGNAGVTDAPLWNRNLSAATFTLYDSTSSTVQATDIGQPSGLSLLCLSCHDGTIGLDAFGANKGSADVTNKITGAAEMGIDLSNDHPVSFTFGPTLFAADGELKDPTSGPVSALLKGAGSDQVECASCHDVHNDQSIDGMLVMSNANSALCTTCHDK